MYILSPVINLIVISVNLLSIWIKNAVKLILTSHRLLTYRPNFLLYLSLYTPKEIIIMTLIIRDIVATF